MDLKPLKVYIDTSVFGGCFDDEFQKYSLKFFDKVKSGEITGVISNIVLDEIAPAPERVVEFLYSLPKENIFVINSSDEHDRLAEKYIQEGILTEKWNEDALHIAIATCVRADAIVSWNFKHIVRFDKIIQFNKVNLINNYQPVSIYSPQEFYYEKEI